MDIDLDWDNTILPTIFYTQKKTKMLIVEPLSDQIETFFVILPNYKHLFCQMFNFNIRCLLTIYRILHKRNIFFQMLNAKLQWKSKHSWLKNLSEVAR